MKKEKAIEIIVSCAKSYEQYLNNSNLLFLFQNEQRYDYIETKFLSENFAHLTGVIVNNATVGTSENFYNRALSQRLSPNDFEFNSNGTTVMKLQVLPALMKFHKVAKMIGQYNSPKPQLYTEKIVGNVCGCFGFIMVDDYYIPNTTLKEDVRDIVLRPTGRIIAIYKKHIEDDKYEMINKAKKVELIESYLPDIVKTI